MLEGAIHRHHYPPGNCLFIPDISIKNPGQEKKSLIFPYWPFPIIHGAPSPVSPLPLEFFTQVFWNWHEKKCNKIILSDKLREKFSQKTGSWL